MQVKESFAHLRMGWLLASLSFYATNWKLAVEVRSRDAVKCWKLVACPGQYEAILGRLIQI